MLRSSCILFVASLLVPTCAGVATAATPVSRESGLHLFDSHTTITPPFPPPYQQDVVFTDLVPYGNAITRTATLSASQQSNISPGGATAVLQSFTGYSSSTLGYFDAKSQFTYTFDVTSPETYSLSGLLTVATIIAPSFRSPYHNGTISLTGPGAAINLHPSADSTPFNFSGTLTPGTYTLYLETYSRDSAHVGGTVDLSANLVLAPEPSTLLTLAAAPLFTLRRHRRR